MTISVHSRAGTFRPGCRRARPAAPGIDLEAQGDERLHLRNPRHSLLQSIAAKLSRTRCPGPGPGSLEDFHLLVSDGFAVGPDRRLHGQVAQHLEQVVLPRHRARCCLVVEGALPGFPNSSAIVIWTLSTSFLFQKAS